MSRYINDKPPDRSPRNLSEMLAVLIVTLFFGGMIILALAEDFSIFKLTVPIFLVSWVVLLVIHEFGHALMARALGWKVEMVSIGTGKVILRKTILGMPTEFRGIPLSGFAIPRPVDLVNPQLKNCLIYAAGPGIELLLVGIIWLIVGNENLFSRQPELGLITGQTFAVAAFLGAVMNLVPLPHETEHGKAASDGLGMILAWTIPDSEYAKMIEEDPKF